MLLLYRGWVFFSFIAAVFISLYFNFWSASFHSKRITSAPTAPGRLQTLCAQTAVWRNWPLWEYVFAVLWLSFFQFYCGCSIYFPLFRLLIRIVSQREYNIGDDGARAIADVMRTNRSVKLLTLVRICCCCIVVEFFAVLLRLYIFPSLSTSDPRRFTVRK